MTRIGLISDTHGLLRPEALDVLSGSDMILHAGDIGSPEVIAGLETVAPVVAVRGNVDRGAWAQAYPETQRVDLDGSGVLLLHNIADLDLRQVNEGVNVVIYGHSHKPVVEEREGLLYVNPGSAGPRRFRLPISLATLRLAPGGPDVRLHQLEV